jgi:hypothetical protein
MFSVVLHDLLGRDDLAGGLSFARVNAWAQSVMAERTLDAGAQGGRLSYNSSSMLDSWLVNLGIGYDGGDRWRVGVSIDGQLTTIEQSQAIADQLRSATGLDAAAINALNAGWATHLRLTLGWQYEVTPKVLLGAVVRTAGLSLLKQASASLEGLADTGRATTTASFFDEDMQWEWRVPFEFRIGAAYVTPRAQAEVNLIVHDGAGRYDAWASSNPIIVVNDAPRPPRPSWQTSTTGRRSSIRGPSPTSPLADTTCSRRAGLGRSMRVTPPTSPRSAPRIRPSRR